MEAVGRLAGGVAHDSNNVLTAILGFAWVAQEETPGETPVALALQEIIAATRRASDPTKRLLVFSRQQVLQPRSLALNARDAMPYGGALTLEVTHVRTNEQTPAADPGIPPGE